ncbi:MAG: alpha/beta hydrolase [Bacteroidetes bacterium]|nr:alpha/beta hydrolase [Bacteroidota bacterium]
MQDWIYPYETKTIQVLDTVDVAYIDEGKGETTLLFIHGLGSNLKSWQKNIDALQTDFRCIAMDLPGYGKSEKGAYSFSMTFFAKAVADLILELKLENVVLVGHSMGGQTAIHLALQNPELLEQMVLVAPAGLETFTQAEADWFKAVYTAEVVRSVTDEQIVANFHANFHQFPEDAQFMIDDRFQMRETVEYDHFCKMVPKCVQGMLSEPVIDRLSEIPLPVLVLYGAEDSLIPNRLLHADLTTKSVAEQGVSRLQNGQLEMLSPCGHFVQWECAEEVNEAIRSFLSKKGSE